MSGASGGIRFVPLFRRPTCVQSAMIVVTTHQDLPARIGPVEFSTLAVRCPRERSTDPLFLRAGIALP